MILTQAPARKHCCCQNHNKFGIGGQPIHYRLWLFDRGKPTQVFVVYLQPEPRVCCITAARRLCVANRFVYDLWSNWACFAPKFRC